MNTDKRIKADGCYEVPGSSDAQVILIPVSLNASESLFFREAFKPIFESAMLPSRLTLDFSRTNFLDSSGIGALASLINTSKLAGVELTTTGVTPQVYSVMKMTRLDQVLGIEAPDAINSQTVIEKSCESGQSRTLFTDVTIAPVV